jgi:hypothetical protein
MLIEKKSVNTGEAVVLRLVTGEEIIGKLVEQTGMVIILYRPQIVHVQFTQSGAAGVALIPLMVSADNDDRVEIPVDRILVQPLKPKRELADEYQRQTSSIVTPPSNKLIV